MDWEKLLGDCLKLLVTYVRVIIHNTLHPEMHENLIRTWHLRPCLRLIPSSLDVLEIKA